MSAESLQPLDELKQLDQHIDDSYDLEELRPIFNRADQLGRVHPGDFEVQIAVSDLKQRLIERGRLLKRAAETERGAASTPGTQTPPTQVPTTRVPAARINIPPPTPAAPTAVPPAPVPPAPMAPVSWATRPPLGQTGTNPPGTPQAVEPADLAQTLLPGQSPASPMPPPLPFAPTSAPPSAVGAALENVTPGYAGTGTPASGGVASNNVPPNKIPPVRSAPAKSGGKKLFLLGAFAVIVVALVVGLMLSRRNKTRLAAGVTIQVSTMPPGAAVRINGEPMCTSNCNVSMPPGNYQITAFMDGYEAAANNVAVQAGKPVAVNLMLEPQPQSVRILTDLGQGKIAFDDQPPADLQDGQFVMEKVAAGTHTIKVTSKTGEATFAVEIADAKQPVLQGPVVAKNLIAVMVTSLGAKARVITNGGPWKLALNGQPQADATPEGVDLNNFMPGVDEILVGEGKDQRNMKESFGPAPMLTAFLKSDLNIGTLIISTGEDDARVFLNNKEYGRKTQHGQVRIPAIGPVNVRVAKDGFEAVAAQATDVKKGSEVRLEFKMQALPQVAILQIRGATPGAEVLLDEKPIGTVGDDGALTSSGVKPGDHAIDLRRDRYTPRHLERTFRAGQTIALTGGDVVLAAATGTVKLARTPPESNVVYRRNDEQQTHELKENQLDLPPGTYLFTARAAGFTDRTERLQVNAGETYPVELALAKVVAVAAPVVAAPKVSGMADFEDAGAWSMQNGLWTHKGAGFIPFKLTPNGTFTFTVQLLHGGNLFRGGRIRWAVQYVDAKNYDLFELDKKYLWSKVVIAGKTFEREKHEHGLSDKEKSYSIQIEATPEHLVHRLKQGDSWTALDTWSEPGRDFTHGKFGFLVQGSDEIGLSDFQYTAK